MSLKKIALIFFLGVVAALSIRSLQADPIPADAVQPALEITIIARQPVLETLKNAVKYNGGAALEFLGKQASNAFNYLEGKSNFQVSGVKVNPLTLTKNTCAFVNNHREAVATAAVILGSIYVYTEYKNWYNKHATSLTELGGIIQRNYKEQKASAIDINNAMAHANQYRNWCGRKNTKLITTINNFYVHAPTLSYDKYKTIMALCGQNIE